MDCVASGWGRRNPSVSSSRFSVAKGGDFDRPLRVFPGLLVLISMQGRAVRFALFVDCAHLVPGSLRRATVRACMLVAIRPALSGLVGRAFLLVVDVSAFLGWIATNTRGLLLDVQVIGACKAVKARKPNRDSLPPLARLVHVHDG